MTPQSIRHAIAGFGTPAYVYDEALIKRNIARFTGIPYAPKAIHFASMANNNPELLRILKRHGLGIFVNSLKHLALALHSGFDVADIIYTTTGISRGDLTFIVDAGVTVNLDSLAQFRLYGALNRGGAVGVRLNIDERSSNNVFVGPESRIGILESEFTTLRQVAAHHGLRIVGTHVYLGTNIPSLEQMLRGAERTLELSSRFPDLEYVDLGGGFPVRGAHEEQFDYASYAGRITTLFERYSWKRGRPIRLILEPGRALFGDTCVFCTRLLDIKERPDRLVLCCDSSASLLPRSLFYNEFYSVKVLGKEDAPVTARPCDIVGQTTYSRDFLGHRVHLPEVEIGDVLVFENTGSYGYSMMTDFLGQAAPVEVCLTAGGDVVEIRPREPIALPCRSEAGAAVAAV